MSVQKKREFKPEDFYSTYINHREYYVPKLKKKNFRNFRNNFWVPGNFKSGMSVFEIGCGVGWFAQFLEYNGIHEYIGIDTDPKLLDFIPNSFKNKIKIIGVDEFLGSHDPDIKFDRIVLIDVLEHFNPGEAVDLLVSMKSLLNQGGGILVRVPNLESPWGLKYHYGDLTHKASYTSLSLKQLGNKSGYKCDIFENRTGNPRKQFVENVFHSLIALCITERPEYWSANIVGFLKPYNL